MYCDQFRASDQASRGDMRQIPEQRRGAGRYQRDRDERHSGDLHHRHQRNRREVQQKAGKGHAREDDRADGQQDQLGRR